MFKRFGQLFSKKVQKVAHFVKNYGKSSIWPKLATFRGHYHVSAFLSNFQQKVAKSGSFREKWRQIIDLAKTLQLLEQAPMSLPFDELFRKKLQKVPRFVKQDEKSSILPKLCNFSNKPPCFGISMKFLARSCKKWLILWESTKNRQFGQNFATLGTSYHVFAFRWTFQKKVATSASFPENAREIIDFVKTCNFSKKLPCLAFRWSLKQKVPRFVKKHEKSSIWPKLCNFSSKLPCFGISMKFSGKICKQCLISWKSTRNHRFQQNLQLFRKNYHVFGFRWTFQKKVEEIASFLEKARKIIDLAKTKNFSNKLPCFGVLVSFSAKSCKKYCRSISGISYNYGVRDLNLLLSPLPRLR